MNFKLRHRPKSYLFFILLAVVLPNLNATALEAEDSPGKTSEVAKTTRKQQMLDARAMDEALARALKLFYDKQYTKALPIFTSIERQIENMDILFWIGTCAAKSGNYDLAIDKFEKMLLLSPHLHRVRLELAVAYFEKGELDKARAAFEAVKKSSPPPNVSKKIDQFLMMIYQREKAFTWNIRFAQGYQYDTNISSGPGSADITDAVEGTMTIDASDQKLDGHKWQSDIALNLLVDPGDPGGLMLNNGYSFLSIRNSEYDKYNYMNAAVFIGPWWTSQRNILKLPLGYTFQHYGTTSLSNVFYLNPSAEHFIAPFISVKGDFNFSIEEYIDQEYADSGHNSKNYAAALSTNLFFDNRNHQMTFKYMYELHDAEYEMHSYTSHSGMISLFSKWPSDTEFYASYKYSDKDYDGPPYSYEKDREDYRHVISLILAQNFFDHYYISLGYDYTQNNADADIYIFEKNLFSLNFGLKF